MKLAILLVAITIPIRAAETAVSYTRFLEHVRAGEVASAAITANSGAAPVRAALRQGGSIRSTLPGDYQAALVLMHERGVNVEIVTPGPSLWNAMPFALLLVVWLILFFRMSRGRGRPGFPWSGKIG